MKCCIEIIFSLLNLVLNINIIIKINTKDEYMNVFFSLDFLFLLITDMENIIIIPPTNIMINIIIIILLLEFFFIIIDTRISEFKIIIVIYLNFLFQFFISDLIF